MGGPKPNDVATLSGGIAIGVRPKPVINKCFIANETHGHVNHTLTNLSGQPLDVRKNYTLVVNITDLDPSWPSTEYMHNITVVGFVNFEGDPKSYAPSDYRSGLNKPNYEFQLNATRNSGGGNSSSIWNITFRFPGTGELWFFKTNSSKLNESDNFKGNGDKAIPGHDGTRDTLEIRWAINFGPQFRNTNNSGTNMFDNWRFYANVSDVNGLWNSSLNKFPQNFDINQFTKISATGSVGGKEAPGGPAFLLNLTASKFQTANMSFNNNATIYVNATNLTTPDWKSSTLGFSTNNLPVADAGWVPIGINYTKIGNDTHSTSSNYHTGDLYWKCYGIPVGTPGGSYTSTVKFAVVLDGTPGPKA